MMSEISVPLSLRFGLAGREESGAQFRHEGVREFGLGYFTADCGIPVIFYGIVGPAGEVPGDECPLVAKPRSEGRYLRWY